LRIGISAGSLAACCTARALRTLAKSYTRFAPRAGLLKFFNFLFDLVVAEHGVVAWRMPVSSPAAMLGALSIAAAERGRYPCKLFDLAEIARREKPRRDHPRPADASHIGQREIIFGLLRVDTAGRAENQIGQGAREGGEITCPASRLGRKEF
jgi:hypothetical protein